MPVRTLGGGDLRVSFPSTLDVRETTRTPTRSQTPTTIDQGVIEDVLHDSGFELVEPLTIRPKQARGPVAADDSAKLDLEVTLRGDDAAVVLTERDGYWSWHAPQRRPRALGDDTATATFELGLRPPGGAPASRGLVDGVRAFVLRFGAPVIAGAAIKVLEEEVHEGLVHITSTDPQSWAQVKSLSGIQLPEGGAPRILLFVHGAFDSTVGAFGSLARGPGKGFLERAIADYDAVVGFDHRTLSMDPLANARDLLARLSVSRADGAVVDVICHSRGGLVTRSLVERLLPASRWRGSVNRIVFVGVPNGGTNLAEPDRWSRLVDVYTSLLLASSPVDDIFLTRAIAGSAIKGVGALVKYLAAYAADDGGVPGLAAMEPDGDFIVDLNRHQPDQPEPGQPWFVISSDFRASAEQTKFKLIEGIADNLLDGANDLVVDKKSMAAVDAPGAYVRRALDFGTNSSVYHTNYFWQAEVAEAMRAWLFAAAAIVPPSIPIDRGPGFDGPMIGRRRSADGGTSRGFDPNVRIRVNGGGAGAAPPPPPGPPVPVQAHVLAEMPEKPVVSEPALVRVLLSCNKIEDSAGTVSDGASVEVDENEVLTVQIVPKRNVVIDGKDTAKFMLPLDDGLSEVGFVVKPCSPGPVVVRIIVRRSPTVIVATMTLEAEARQLDDAIHRQTLVRQQVEAASSTSVDLKDAVWLEISELERRGYVQFQYDLRLPDGSEMLRYTSEPLRKRATYVANLFKGIEDNWMQCVGRPKEFMRFLQDQGAHLFEELFPVDLQQKLWEYRDRLKSILLLADEPYFPWELVHLKPPGKPRQQPPRFLGQYGLLRWQFLPFPAKPELQWRPGRVYSVCPDYVDPALVLAENQVEAEYLKLKLGAAAVPASATKVREILRNREVDILHFSGHGVANPRNVGGAKILLRGRNVGRLYAREYLSATTVEETAELAGEDGAGPLVVLNACQIGISGEELSSLGGFARAFLEAGAQAFVSCLWSVQGRPSRIFVETLYNRLLEGDSIGEAAVRARTAARTDDDPATWLGFIIYARPDAKFVRA
jgi:hypothetical protein